MFYSTFCLHHCTQRQTLSFRNAGIMADSSLFPSYAKNKNTQACRQEGGGREEEIEVKKVIPVELPLKLDLKTNKKTAGSSREAMGFGRKISKPAVKRDLWSSPDFAVTQ